MFQRMRPQDNLEESDVQQGLKMLLFDGISSQIMGVLTGGAFLVAFALLLGASNKIIGILAAVGPLSQILQIPAIFLVDRLRMRKALVIGSSIVSRSFWLVIAALPWLLPAPYRVPVFLGCLFLYFALGSISGCAFNSWMRDLIPEKMMGNYFARRWALSIGVGAGVGLLAAIGVDLYKRFLPHEIAAYSALFVIGSVAGFVGLAFMARIPEPRMSISSGEGLISLLGRPFRDRNFRSLLVFLGSWNFAASFAAPFFTVYMLERLNLSMTYVLAFVVLSQVVNVLFLRLWGDLADRFSNKSVLAVSGPLFMISTLAWPFTTMPERYILTIPILIGIHILAGMSTAGVLLSSGNIALKAAPRGTATVYLAMNALVSGVAATIAPIAAGFLADWFVGQELSCLIAWSSTNGASPHSLSFPAINLRGLDFLFILSFIFGIYSLHRLLAVHEEGEVEEKVVAGQLYAEVRKAVRHVSSVAGMRQLTYFPFSSIKFVVSRTPLGRRRMPYQHY